MTHQHAIARGLEAHGIEVEKITAGAVKTEHVACWGWRVGKKLHSEGHQVLVMERGYLGDRFAWTSLAWNGLNGKGKFAGCFDDQRFARHFSMKPWKTAGDYVLLMGQVPGDASLQGMDLTPWYGHAAMQAQNAYEMPVRFRQHPMSLARGYRQRPPYTEASTGTLDEALDGAAVVVTYNSNSGVDAVIAGVPTVAMDKGSMAWDVAAHRIGDLIRPDREQWAGHLACKQWTIEEIESGFALGGLLKEIQ